MTLKPESSEKFVSFLETVLHSFSIVLDHITVSEIDRVTKDLLGHLRTFMKILPVSSVHCVVQVKYINFLYLKIFYYLKFT